MGTAKTPCSRPPRITAPRPIQSCAVILPFPLRRRTRQARRPPSICLSRKHFPGRNFGSSALMNERDLLTACGSCGLALVGPYRQRRRKKRIGDVDQSILGEVRIAEPQYVENQA